MAKGLGLHHEGREKNVVVGKTSRTKPKASSHVPLLTLQQMREKGVELIKFEASRFTLRRVKQGTYTKRVNAIRREFGMSED